jgi:ribosomal protein L12E/L44/L45/RPP1/RPP2
MSMIAVMDSRVGSQYGDYARRAADGLVSFNDALKGKDVDDLFNDARELVAKAPAVAVGTAAALGFIVARLAKAGLDKSADKDAPSA